MNLLIKDLLLKGDRIIKYNKSPNGDHHLFLYRFNNRYFSFEMIRGEYIKSPNHDLKNKIVNSHAVKLSLLKEYYNSTLNEWFVEGSKLDDDRYVIEGTKTTYNKTKLILN